MSDTKKIEDAADALAAALWPEVERLTQQKGTGALTAMMTVARPYLRSALGRIEHAAPDVDRRTVPYTVSAMFWDITDGEGEAELYGEAEEETVYGLPAVLDKLARWIAEVHAGDEGQDAEELDDDASAAALASRVATLRTSVTRGKGIGAFRQYYTADGYKMLCHATVKRAADEVAP